MFENAVLTVIFILKKHRRLDSSHRILTRTNPPKIERTRNPRKYLSSQPVDK